MSSDPPKRDVDKVSARFSAVQNKFFFFVLCGFHLIGKFLVVYRLNLLALLMSLLHTVVLQNLVVVLLILLH